MKSVQTSRIRAGLLATVTLIGAATLAGCHNPYGPPGDTGGQRDPYRRGWVEPCDEPVSYASVSIYSSTSYGHYDDDCGPSYCPPPVEYCPPPVTYCPPPKSYGHSYGGHRDDRGGHRDGRGGGDWGGGRGGGKPQAAAPKASTPPKSYSPPPAKNYAPPKQVAAIPAGRGFGKSEATSAPKPSNNEHKSGGFRNGLDRSR